MVILLLSLCSFSTCLGHAWPWPEEPACCTAHNTTSRSATLLMPSLGPCVCPQVVRLLWRSGLLAKLGEERLHVNLHSAVEQSRSGPPLSQMEYVI